MMFTGTESAGSFTAGRGTFTGPKRIRSPLTVLLRRCMKALFAESRQSLGSRRMSKRLREEGFDVGRYRARRLMKAMGLVVKAKRKYKVTTDSNHR